jgi:hypothetical protein
MAANPRQKTQEATAVGMTLEKDRQNRRKRGGFQRSEYSSKNG